MKFTTLQLLLSTTIATSLIAITGQQAFAGSLYNGWNYSIDSFKDGTEGNTIGEKSKFEFYGLAMKQTDDRVFFAINSNLSLTGYADNGARNKRISYGDLFLNFTNLNSFNSASSQSNLFAIRFDATNDTASSFSLGLYGNVKATSLTTVNHGYGKLQDHTNAVNTKLKGSASYGDLEANTTYFTQNQAAYTTISSGNRLGDVTSLGSSDLSLLGLNFEHFGTKGTQTFGFSVDKASLPDGNFIANLFAECGNDGVALAGELKDVPEPSIIAGLAMVGGLTVSRRRRKTGAIAQ